MFWVGIGCLNGFINSVVWNGNMVDRSPGWCDFSSRVILTENVSIAVCSLAINRRLFFIATSDTVMVSAIDRRRAMLFDSLLCFLTPLAQVAVG